jgi:hypothetical protein
MVRSTRNSHSSSLFPLPRRFPFYFVVIRLRLTRRSVSSLILSSVSSPSTGQTSRKRGKADNNDSLASTSSGSLESPVALLSLFNNFTSLRMLARSALRSLTRATRTTKPTLSATAVLPKFVLAPTSARFHASLSIVSLTSPRLQMLLHLHRGRTAYLSLHSHGGGAHVEGFGCVGGTSSFSFETARRELTSPSREQSRSSLRTSSLLESKRWMRTRRWTRL